MEHRSAPLLHSGAPSSNRNPNLHYNLSNQMRFEPTLHERLEEEIHETPSQSVLSHSSIALLLWPRAGSEGTRVRRIGVQRIEDPHHPRGYRELRSKAEMRKLLYRKIVEQHRQCAICQVAFTHYNDIVSDYMDPRGMGGSRRQLPLFTQQRAVVERQGNEEANQAPASISQYLHDNSYEVGDAPLCVTCGSLMVRNGSCHKCANCGGTSGCSYSGAE